MSSVDITIMPLNYNGRDLLETCLPTIRDSVADLPVKTETWVIDNNSTDDSKTLVREKFPRMKFISYSENRKLEAYNEAIRQCQSEFVLILNNDMLLNKNSVMPLYRRMQTSNSIFAVSPKVLADQENERYLSRRIGRFQRGHLASIPVGKEVAGACMYFHGGAALLRRQMFLDLGGFDPMFFYFEDNDLSWRAWKRGWSCIFEPSADVFHLGGRTVAKVFGEGSDRKRALKERASRLFILKNISDPRWLGNFKAWNILKFFSMLWNIDSARLWAIMETRKWQSRIPAPTTSKISDAELLEKVESMELPPLS